MVNIQLVTSCSDVQFMLVLKVAQSGVIGVRLEQFMLRGKYYNLIPG